MQNIIGIFLEVEHMKLRHLVYE